MTMEGSCYRCAQNIPEDGLCQGCQREVDHLREVLEELSKDAKWEASLAKWEARCAAKYGPRNPPPSSL